MTVAELLTALADNATPVRVDLTTGEGTLAKTYRVESNELDILDSTTKALVISSMSLAVDGKTAYILVTAGAA